MSMNRRSFLRLSGASVLGLAVLALPEAAQAALGAARPVLRCEPAAHRVVAVWPGGREVVLGRLGTGPGAFNFPCAAAVDAAGRLHVLDRGNGRVQVLDAAGTCLASFPVAPGARDLDLDEAGGVGVVDAVGGFRLYREGREVATAQGLGRLKGVAWTPAGWHALDAAGRRVVVLDGQARPVREVALVPGSVPCALAASPDGLVAVLDGATGAVQQLDGLTLAALPAGTRRFAHEGGAWRARA
jgi:DNA-binding beta-propeller fold protein YncE